MCHRWNAEADMRIQLSSIKVDLKDMCKNIKQCQPFYSLTLFVLKNNSFFHKNILFMLTCKGFTIVIFKWINKYFSNLFQFLLLYTDTYILHRQKLFDIL